MTKNSNEFSRWLEDYEKAVKPEYDKEGPNLPEGLDSYLLQHYLTYKINKSNQKMLRLTWILVIVTLMCSVLAAIINLVVSS